MKPRSCLRFALFAIGLLCTVRPALAEPRIDIGFETDPAYDQKLIHASAVFPARQAVVYGIFDRTDTYPALHDWIRATTLLESGEDRREVLVEFSFPWPVGREWSRVEIRRSGDTITWRQVEGSIRANRGRISFSAIGNQVRIDYRAAIDIGLPEAWTQSYKAKFVREFLSAAWQQASTAPSTLALAAGRRDARTPGR